MTERFTQPNAYFPTANFNVLSAVDGKFVSVEALTEIKCPTGTFDNIEGARCSPVFSNFQNITNVVALSGEGLFAQRVGNILNLSGYLVVDTDGITPGTPVFEMTLLPFIRTSNFANNFLATGHVISSASTYYNGSVFSVSGTQRIRISILQCTNAAPESLVVYINCMVSLTNN